jgi:glycosyltransferase involved in cell wall biosynthesis
MTQVDKGMIRPRATIGIPIYNSASNVKSLLFALKATGAALDNHAELIVYDDGSEDQRVVSEVESFCACNGVAFVRGERNRGVPTAWNQITRRASADVVLMLNDDVRPVESGWFDEILSVFDLNSTLGIAYWCQKRVDAASGIGCGFTPDSGYIVESQIRHPLLRSNFCGAFFAFRKSLWEDVKQPDGSVGFWEDLLAYGEEIDFSSECHIRGMHILQLPVVWEHMQSQTFATNPSQRMRPILSPYLNEADYRRLTRTYRSIFGTDDISSTRFKTKLLEMVRRRKPPRGIVKLHYSLAMLIKKWKDRRILGYPGGEYICRLLADGFPKALHHAIENGSASAPDRIWYRYQSIERTASREECLSDPTLCFV